MRPTMATCLTMLLLATPLASAQSTTVPATQKAISLDPVPTPSEAVLRSMQAMVDGDEAAYRRVVDVRSPHGYSEAYTRWVFAAARLENAVREHNVVGKRVREAGFDRNERLSTGASPPPAKEWEAQRKAIEAMEWEVVGDRAHPKGNPSAFSGGTQGKTSIERSGDGWMIVIADPAESAPPEHLQQFAMAWSTKAAAFDAATARVKAGKFKTILEVNDFIDGESKKSKPAK
jgi:hypothetical protein